MARHRRPVNVRDDGLPAVLGPLVNEGGVERAVLLDVDSGMVLDAWARGEGVAPDDAAAGSGATPSASDTVPGGGRVPGGGASLDAGAAFGDVEALGARHADLVRALFALAGTPPAELSLAVDDRHHLVRCVADPAGGRLALAVVVAGSSWVVRRVRRHLRQLPDAGLTTGPWILSWAMGPPPEPKPPADRPQATGLSSADRPTAEPPATVIGGWLPSSSVEPQSGGAGGWLPSSPAQQPDGAGGWPASSPVEPHPAFRDGRPRPAASDRWTPLSTAGPQPGGADGWPPSAGVPSPDEPHRVFADGAPPSPPAELQAAVDGFPSPVPAGSAFEGSPPSPNDDTPTTDPTTAVPDPRRGPAPPSALPPARSAGGR